MRATKHNAVFEECRYLPYALLALLFRQNQNWAGGRCGVSWKITLLARCNTPFWWKVRVGHMWETMQLFSLSKWGQESLSLLTFGLMMSSSCPNWHCYGGNMIHDWLNPTASKRINSFENTEKQLWNRAKIVFANQPYFRFLPDSVFDWRCS